MSQNFFSGGPQINERELNMSETDMGGKGNECLTNQSGEPLKLDGGGMYAPFNQEQKTPNCHSDSLSPEESNKPEKAGENLETSEFKQNPNYPIIKRFTEIQGVNISSEDMLKINKVLLGLEDFDILKLEKNLKGNFFSDPKLEPCLLRYLLKITRLNPQLIRNEDLKIEKIDLPKEFKNNDILNDENSEIIKLLAQNYIKIPDGVHGEPNFDKDIQTCFDITVNKIIDKKQFQENESFGIAMQDIKSGDIETKLQAITYIYSLVNTSQGIGGKRSAELFRQMLQEHSKKKKDYFELKTVKLETKLKDETDAQKRKDIMQEIENLNKRKNEDDFSGEVFSAGKQDYISDKAPGE